ncbi:phospholipase A2 inhibitor subunit gamma B-like [Crotalus tigris]|uniref:phospholipase A2 inhibitor subunit gamma B-like n=1 Tax=Crotalus tigris TaxID=88082 RepID=UPI00192F8FBD|nr:phospholipase A2 inhibitor subunit gamma B-like [Crotalus tigris]
MGSLRLDNMQALLKLLFCFLLLAKGGCLKCEICVSNSTSCTGPKQNCTKGDTCIVAITISTMEQVPEYNFEKKCGFSSSCDNSQMYYNVGNGQMFRHKQYCCTEETCSKISPTLPTLQKDPEGKKCPACNSLGEPCKEDSKVECSGDDPECFILTMNLTLDGELIQHIMKGCSSKNMCDIMQSGVESVLDRNVIKCIFSGVSQVLACFLTTFSSLWILKLLV